MKREIPIRSRLTFWYTAVLSLSLLLFSLTIWLALRHWLTTDLSASLLNQAHGFEAYLRIEDQDPNVDLAREISEYSQSWLLDHLLVVYDKAGKCIYASSPDLAGRSSELTRSNRPAEIRYQRRPYLGSTRTINLRQGSYSAFLAISSASVSRAVELLGWLLLLAVPLFIFGAAAGGYWLSRSALQPVDRITERARSIGVHNLSHRLLVPNTNDELQRLTETWNAMLERLDAVVSRISSFTADASHELRTPVAIIRLAAENALRKPRSDTEYQAALQRIQKESENMTRLIADLLFLARADVTAARVDPEIVLLQDLIADVCSALAPFATAKGVTLTEQLPPSSVHVLGNPSDLRRMLLILLDNAIKYTPPAGSASIRVDCEPQHARITVEDSGVGIPEELKDQVFQRFFRVDPSRNRDSGGYGLGLAIAQAIARQHHAEIKLASAVFGGSTFFFSLPLAFERAAHEELAASEPKLTVYE